MPDETLRRIFSDRVGLKDVSESQGEAFHIQSEL